jgi:teichuronic acid biosynthesis glycosyltransferase TuaC
MRILTFTTLYPSAARPQHGVFVENRLRHLVASGEVSARVVAPTVWFPSTDPRFGSYAAMARTAPHETRHGIEIEHPRFLLLPKINMSWAPFSLYLAARRSARRLAAAGYEPDLIDAHYFYPDGVAAALLARALGKPFVVTARGSDVNVIAEHALPRRMIRWTIARAAGLIAVAQALADRLSALGAPATKLRVLRNGVDLATFHPTDRDAARRELGLGTPTLLCVASLTANKGHAIVIGALPRLPGVVLLIAGQGPERGNLEAQARQLDVADRVRFLGQQPHEALPRLYGAADILVLGSQNEGWPNVLLEAMACGTPVVATRAGGIAEVVAVPEAGRLMAARTPEACAEAVGALLAALPDRAATRRYAEGFSWDATTRGQIDLFREILERCRT